MQTQSYKWKRFWCPREGSLSLHDGGYLVDPEGPYGQHWNADLHPFDSIAVSTCLVMLGEPGMGKTSTMQSERKAIDVRVRAGGGDTLWLDLRSCGSEYQLARKFFESQKFASWLAGDYHLHVFLDSLDECRLRVENVASVLADELEEIPTHRLSLRISCRTAEWPKTLEDGLRELWAEESIGVFELAPLRRVDVAAAAAANGLDPDAFLQSVHEAEAVPLAIKPVTLGFLLESYDRSGWLPSRQIELYSDGCRRLCEERNDSRVDAGRTGKLSADQRLAVAARIAAVTTFSNKYAVWTGRERANPEEGDVIVRELAGGTESDGEDEFAVSEDAITEALGTGLFSARGPERLGWAHQTYAEFLAARYLIQRGVETEQAMSLIVHPGDEQDRLVPQLHEAAAWLASMSPEVFRAITYHDPEILLRSDVASTDVENKVALVATMLRLYDEERLLDVGLMPQSQYRKLEHTGLTEQLRSYIADSDKGVVVRRVALDIAEACELRALQGEAVEVALDTDQPFLVRKEAARFVAHVGDGPTRGRLKPLAIGEAGDDPDGDLKGWGLDAVWPEHMSAEELFGTLTRPNERYFGTYASFLSHELPERLRPADLPVALAWVEDQQRRHDMPYRLAELMDQIMLRAWEHLDVPSVRRAFARAALARLRQYDEIVQKRTSAFAVSEEPSFSERVDTDDQKRRGLMDEMLELLQAEEDDAWLLIHYKTPLMLKRDAAWLIEKLEGETSDRKRAVLATLLQRAFYGWDDEQHEIVYLAYQRNPALADEVSSFFDPVDLSSEEARDQRRYHEKIKGRRERREVRPSPDPPLAERVIRALEDFERGDVDAFWQRLDYFL
jgi:predicted NACHT family NTPase